MKKKLLFLSVVIALTITITAFVAPKKQNKSAKTSHSKVILMSFDGFMNETLKLYLKDEFKTKGLGIIQKEGILAADGLKVSLPSLTATSHLSLATGTPPSQHGVVSNTFHQTSDPITQGTNGFSANLSPSTPAIWEIAMQKGLKVGSISYPGIDLQNERRTPHFGLAYTNAEYPSYAVYMTPEAFENHPHTLPKDIQTYSVPLKSHLYLYEKTSEAAPLKTDPVHGYTTDVTHEGNERQIPFTVISLDTTNDQKRNYDSLLFDNDEDLSNGYVGIVDLKNHPWIELTFLSGELFKGSRCRLLELKPDLSKVSIYVGGLHKNSAFPKSFAARVQEKIGIWPGAPERKPDILTTDMILEQAIYFSEYLKKATFLAAQTYDYDLLLTYQPILDELQHSFFLIDPKQQGYSESLSREYLSVIHRAYLHANRVIDDFMKSQKETNLVIVSDHGMAPLHTVYFPNRVLLQRGFIEEDASGQKTFYAHAYSSGGLSHIYLNLQGREPGGIVPKSQYDTMVQRLVDIFKDAPSIDFILTQKDARDYGLNHPNSGDVILVANPGYHLTDLQTPGNITEPASFYGQHGYDPSLKIMKGIFAAWGPDITPQQQFEEVSYTDVFPFVKNLLK